MFTLNKNYFIQTPTLYFTGKLIEQDEHFLRLESAAWIAETGRFTQALQTTNFNEVELFNSSLIVAKNAIIAATELTGPLPSTQN